MFEDTWYDPCLAQFPLHTGTHPVQMGAAVLHCASTGRIQSSWKVQRWIYPGSRPEVTVPSFPNFKCTVHLYPKLPAFLRGQWHIPSPVDYPGYAPVTIGFDRAPPGPPTEHLPYALSSLERDAVHHALDVMDGARLEQRPELQAPFREVLRRLLCHS